MNKSEFFSEVSNLLLKDNKEKARETIINKYPHTVKQIKKRRYSNLIKMKHFFNDGFIDRYTGEKLINPGLFKVLSTYFPEEFPYDAHWSTTKTHNSYWVMFPTIDHIVPIARGGEDCDSNRVTTTMKNNLIKDNYTLEEIGWKLYPQGSIEQWDGLTEIFIKIVEKDEALLKDKYIENWYKVSQKIYGTYLRIKKINVFAKKWIKKFTDDNINYVELVDHYLADDCDEIGFIMDCGRSFSEKYGKAFEGYLELEPVINDIYEIDLIGSAIYSKWRFYNHWAYDSSSILCNTSRDWFIAMFERIIEITEQYNFLND